jgi:hypothetical protein
MVGGRTCVTGFALALAAGCGGGDGGEISRESIASCLREADAEVSTTEVGFFYLYSAVSEAVWEREGLVASFEDNNDVAVLAVTGEGVSVTGGSDEAGLAFSIAEMGLEGQAEDLLKRYGNVVVEWGEKPTNEQTETLEGCVS